MSARNWRQTREYRIWRVKVIRRDRRCQVCGSIKNRHAHHLNHASYFVDQRFDPDNGICLCRDCHYQFHINYKGGNRKKCTKEDFRRFSKIIRYVESLQEKE